jgi:hypothetical protein
MTDTDHDASDDSIERGLRIRLVELKVFRTDMLPALFNPRTMFACGVARITA